MRNAGTLLAAALLLAVAAVVAGCSSEPAPAPPPTDAPAASSMTVTEYAEEIGCSGRDTAPSDEDDTWGERIADLDRSLTLLNSVTPPPEISDLHFAVRTVLKSMLRDIHRFAPDRDAPAVYPDSSFLARMDASSYMVQFAVEELDHEVFRILQEQGCVDEPIPTDPPRTLTPEGPGHTPTSQATPTPDSAREFGLEVSSGPTATPIFDDAARVAVTTVDKSRDNAGSDSSPSPIATPAGPYREPTPTPGPPVTREPYRTPDPAATNTPRPTSTPADDLVERTAYLGGYALAGNMADSCLQLGLMIKAVQLGEEDLKEAFLTGLGQIGRFELPFLEELAEDAGEAEWPRIYTGLTDGLIDGRNERC